MKALENSLIDINEVAGINAFGDVCFKNGERLTISAEDARQLIDHFSLSEQTKEKQSDDSCI